MWQIIQHVLLNHGDTIELVVFLVVFNLISTVAICLVNQKTTEKVPKFIWKSLPMLLLTNISVVLGLSLTTSVTLYMITTVSLLLMVVFVSLLILARVVEKRRGKRNKCVG